MAACSNRAGAPLDDPQPPLRHPAHEARPDAARLPLAVPASQRWPALAPFRTRSFRYQWPADLGTAWALEMETLILGWYVLVESGSVVMLTVFGALMFVGTLLAPLMGTLGDRLGLRRVLATMRLSYALLASVILWLAATGRLEPSLVLGVAFLVGLIKPSDIGMRTALVSASVPAAHLVPAMGISRTTQDSARIGGALAGAGFMASLGMVSAYVVITSLYVLGAVFTMRSVARGASRWLARRPRVPACLHPGAISRKACCMCGTRRAARCDALGGAGQPVRLSAQRRAHALHRARRLPA
jgi:MFS family permease